MVPCPDARVLEYQQAGILRLQSYLSPRSDWAATDPDDVDGDCMPRPETLDDYAAWVTAPIERYDGDGEGDMPTLISTEP